MDVKNGTTLFVFATSEVTTKGSSHFYHDTTPFPYVSGRVVVVEDTRT